MMHGLPLAGVISSPALEMHALGVEKSWTNIQNPSPTFYPSAANLTDVCRKANHTWAHVKCAQTQPRLNCYL
jgi:hypothetical protein